ncbi:hypothetical protein TH9_05085 [Thalassospira xiamenensis]|uniref:hypothetical protein n=1 Tax=Thalassospira xiamenensis TaxID=220697 RepID=UPI000DFE36C2|nr:hypothetical protein [Thalassospira xiamenensis]RCK36029.1 hypothetical protein TH9_05085 [Thalassospira xiamenensis]
MIFAYSLLGLLIAIIEIRRLKLQLPINSLTLFNGAYFLFFVIPPIGIVLLGEDAVRQKYAYRMWGYGDFFTAFSLIFSYICFVFGYFHRKKHTSRQFHTTISTPNVLNITMLFLLLGAVGMLYHISLVGDVFRTLKLAPIIRSGQFPLEGNYLFIRQLSTFISTAFMLMFALYIDVDSTASSNQRCKASSRKYFIILTLLTVFFVYYALSTYGRREFVYPVFICLLIWLNSEKKRSWGVLVFLSAVCLIWFFIYSFVIPYFLHSMGDLPPESQIPPATIVKNAYFGILQALGDSFMHFVAAEQAELWQFGFLTDIWEIPLQMLPSQLLGFERPRGMFGETSQFILGRPLEHGLSGEEPLGMHGYLLVNFSYAGMFFVFYLFGRMIQKLDKVLRPSGTGSAIEWLVYLWLIWAALEFLREGVLILVIKPHLSWWLAICILLWLSRRSLQRKNLVNSNRDICS